MVTPQDDDQDFKLAIEYLCSHPVLSKAFGILLDYLGDEFNEIRGQIGMRKKRPTIRGVAMHGRHKRKIDLLTPPVDQQASQ